MVVSHLVRNNLVDIVNFCFSLKYCAFGSDKVSMWTHTYPHNPVYVWPDVWSGDLQVKKKYSTQRF